MSSGSQNWRQEVDAVDYFGHQKKQQSVDSRRPVIRKIADLAGPGIAMQAVRLTNFNDALATYNGFYSAAPGAVSAPTPGAAFIGTVVGDAELGGVQTFTNLTTEAVYQRVFRRNPGDAATIYWGNWTVVG